MLHTETVDANTLDLLKQIQSNPHFRETRLVGGTALALQIGHRKSIDLDIFGNIKLEPLELTQELQTYGTISMRSSSQRIHRLVLRGVQLDIIQYDYPWLDVPVVADGVRLASVRDIAAMKLAAITNRGTKKDFVDLAFLLDRLDLPQMLDLYKQKFKDGESFMVLKSLAFFGDAEEDPMPFMLLPIDWNLAKQRIIESVRKPLPNSGFTTKATSSTVSGRNTAHPRDSFAVRVP